MCSTFEAEKSKNYTLSVELADRYTSLIWGHECDSNWYHCVHKNNNQLWIDTEDRENWGNRPDVDNLRWPNFCQEEARLSESEILLQRYWNRIMAANVVEVNMEKVGELLRHLLKSPPWRWPAVGRFLLRFPNVGLKAWELIKHLHISIPMF